MTQAIFASHYISSHYALITKKPPTMIWFKRRQAQSRIIKFCYIAHRKPKTFPNDANMDNFPLDLFQHPPHYFLDCSLEVLSVHSHLRFHCIIVTLLYVKDHHWWWGGTHHLTPWWWPHCTCFLDTPTQFSLISPTLPCSPDFSLSDLWKVTVSTLYEIQEASQSQKHKWSEWDIQGAI